VKSLHIKLLCRELFKYVYAVHWVV